MLRPFPLSQVLSRFFSRSGRYSLMAVVAGCVWVAGHFLPIAWGNLTVASAQSTPLTIAMAVSLSGAGASYGRPALEGAQLAIEEANAAQQIPITLAVYDDESNPDRAQQVAADISTSKALVVVGPATTPMSLAAGPVYAKAAIASIGTTATGDGVTANSTTFRASFSTSDGGAAIAAYLHHALNGNRAAVLFKDDGFGQPFAAGFRRVAQRLNLTTTYYPFRTAAQAQAIAQQVAADPQKPAIVLGMLVTDAVPIVTTIKRRNAQATLLGTNTIAGEFFADFFKTQPEEQNTPGYFTNGVYAASPLFFDSGNAETLAFADRFRARFQHDPSYIEVQGYEAARLAIAAVRSVAQTNPKAEIPTRRQAVQHYLASLNSPAKGIPGLNGTLWFTSQRGREQPLRFGRFQDGIFESAPIQLVPVLAPDRAELAAGAVFPIAPATGSAQTGHGQAYARLQQIVYTGVFLNELPRLDLAKSEFTADFYLWLRFAQAAGRQTANPINISFPQLIDGTFDPNKPAEQRQMPDGTQYWLWHIQGNFRNDFDLRRFPFDRQQLSLSFFNARAPMEQIVYVVDQRSLPVAAANGTAANGFNAIASVHAFRDLTQWQPLTLRSRRENLVTHSALGNPVQSAIGSQRELSGFLVSIELERRALATLAKNLLPLVLMTLIMYASLFFPIALVKEKVTVAVTAALSGAVLLTSINNQLGSVGYTMAVEYAFYIFFLLSLLCIMSVLWAEQLRSNHQPQAADQVLRGTRVLFLLAVLFTLAGATVLYWQR